MKPSLKKIAGFGGGGDRSKNQSTIEVHHFFSEVPQIRKLRPLPIFFFFL